VYDWERVVGAKVSGGQLLFRVRWAGSPGEWGANAETWEPFDKKVAAASWGGNKKLVGRRLLVKFSPKVTCLAEVGDYNVKEKKHYIDYIDEAGEDNEFLNLSLGEKEWQFTD